MNIAGKTQTVDQPGESTVDVRECCCGDCGNRFWVQVTNGTPWQPSFCAFCGRGFSFALIDGEPAVFNPKRGEDGHQI